MSCVVPEMMTIEWLREAYSRQLVTPEEVIRVMIERAEADREMNIWITPPRMERIRPYLERLDTLDPRTSPLWGVPFAVKDNIDVAGIPTTAGCPDYQFIPQQHAAVVAKLIEAGAIPVGKTNLDQFATGLVGTRSPYGETHNALRPELISGGSSSGSSVAVARGQAAFALGTDTAGSGRVPAALNRLVGYKPPLGAWSTSGVVPACASLDCVSVFTWQLADARVVDGVVRGYDADDPWSREIGPAVARMPKQVCLPKGELSFFGPYAEAYRSAWEKTVRRLQNIYVNIRYVDTDVFEQAAALLYGGPFVEERRAGLGGFVEANPGSLMPETETVLRSGADAGYDGASVFRAMHRLQSLKLAARRLLGDGVLVLPTTGGTWSRADIHEQPIRRNQDLGQYTNHCNLLDMSAVAVPGEDAEQGLPFGITFFAMAEHDGAEVAAAEAFLEAMNRSRPAAGEDAASVQVAVCGLHMRGYPLAAQMERLGASFLRDARTSPAYQLVKLAMEPPRPGLIRKEAGGACIDLEIWEMPVKSLGELVATVPSPLGIGRVELEDGTEVTGFICEAFAASSEGAEDITSLGGWRAAVRPEAGSAV
ncbi:allophanate hydrolase [Paenibacillus cisolokensis]|uniref:allophanate hydrolase n=1 Tax=Paenibacillus cisolokensis TaxID=1658519 RepID=UPI003D2DAAEF